MPEGSRIPRSITSFNTYLTNTSAYLQEGTPTNAERLSIEPEESTFWTTTYSTWQPLYAKYNDKKNNRTTAIILQLKNLIRDFLSYDKSHHLLDRVAASMNATVIDLETLNIKKGPLQKTTKTIPSTPIETLVIPKLKPIGGGVVAVKCQNDSNNRTAIISNANTVQYRYTVGTEAPLSANDENLEMGLSTRASFDIPLNAGNAGKNLYIYFRWNNTKHSEIAGPWCSMKTTLIL